MAKLSNSQITFCHHLSAYENGTKLDIATSQYLSAEVMKKMDLYATASTVRSIEKKGGIKILTTYWRGIEIEIIDSQLLSELAINKTCVKG